MKTKQPKSFTDKQILAAVAARDAGGPEVPVEVLDAWFPRTIVCGEFELQPVLLSVIMALHRINSTMLSSDSQFSPRDIANALFILTVPIAETRRLLGVHDPEAAGTPAEYPHFAAAVDLLSDRVAAAQIAPLAQLINEHLTKAFNNLVPHGVSKSTDPKQPFPEAAHPAGTGAAPHTAGSSH